MEQFLIAALRVVCLVHLTVLLAHSVLERRYARRHVGDPPDPGPPARWPSVDVIVPVFNEDPALLEACWRSLAAVDYPGPLRVWLIDDGSANVDELRPVYARFKQRFPRPEHDVLFLVDNAGKRRAQDEAFGRSEGELVVLMDSDTVVEPDALRRAVAALGDDENVAAVSGRLGVVNAGVNRLTRLLDQRYRLRFGVERPAQGLFNSVLCCAGPFTLFRRRALRAVWEPYQRQTFLGVHCTYGDDLHLTNLLLAGGRQLLYLPVVVACTGVPVTLGAYLHQQVRWSRSLYRELGWTVRAVRGRHPYLGLDMLARAGLPLLLGGAIALLAAGGLLGGWAPFLDNARLVGAMLVVGAAFVWRHGELGSLVLLYGPLHVALLIPVRVWALLTLASSRWETR